MNCPHCESYIGFFGQRVKRAGKHLSCEDCGKAIKIDIDFKWLLFLFVLTKVFISFAAPGRTWVADAIMVGIAVMFSFKPSKAE